MDATAQKSAKPRRRWLHFRLRTLLLVVTLLSIPCGWVGWELDQRRQEKEVVTWIEEIGGEVEYFFGSVKISWWEKKKDKWFGSRVQEVRLSAPVSDLSPLAKLKSLELLYLFNTPVSAPLAELKSLKLLYLTNTPVSDLSPLAELKSLEILVLSETQVSDVSPLAELKSLRLLGLLETQVNEEQAHELRQALPKCDIAVENNGRGTTPPIKGD